MMSHIYGDRWPTGQVDNQRLVLVDRSINPVGDVGKDLRWNAIV